MKARLRSVILSAIGVISAFTIVSVSSCVDKCKSISCAYDGVCADGKCICQTGYEGPQCETLTRKKFIGTWVVSEVGSVSDASQYTVSIDPPPTTNLTEVRIKNFRNFIIDDVVAFVKADTIYIPQQEVQNHIIVGTGVIGDEKYYGDNGHIVMKYKITNKATGVTDDFGADGHTPSTWNK
jgi:hypothetical protein